MPLPYSLPYFLDLVDDLESKKRFVTVSEILTEGIEQMQNTVLLRFDVERDPKHTLLVAQELANRNAFGSFYFHSRSEVYDVAVMTEIQSLGHEVGYHHECLDRAFGNAMKARKIFIDDVRRFREDGIKLNTVCQHSEVGFYKNGYNSNADLFRIHPELLNDLSILGEVYIDLNLRWGEVYVSDTFKGMTKFDKMIEDLKSNDGFTGILIHPHRWREHFSKSVAESGSDLFSMIRRKMTGSLNQMSAIESE